MPQLWGNGDWTNESLNEIMTVGHHNDGFNYKSHLKWHNNQLTIFEYISWGVTNEGTKNICLDLSLVILNIQKSCWQWRRIILFGCDPCKWKSRSYSQSADICSSYHQCIWCLGWNTPPQYFGFDEETLENKTEINHKNNHISICKYINKNLFISSISLSSQ